MTDKNDNKIIQNINSLLDEIKTSQDSLSGVSDTVIDSLKRIAITLQNYDVAAILRDEQILRQNGEEQERL